MSDSDSQSEGEGRGEDDSSRIVSCFDGLGIDPYRSGDFIVYLTFTFIIIIT